MIRNDEIVKELDKILSNSFGFERDSYLQINGITHDIGITQLFFNDNFFSFDYPNKRILHFTDLNSALLILKSQVFRARSLESISEDKEELIYCLKLIDQYNEIIESQKKYSFIACFTPFENNKTIEDFDFHWAEYGNKHKGIAFEFEIIRQPLYTDHYSLNVNYLVSIEEQHTLLDYLKGKKTDTVLLKALIPFFASIKQKDFDSEKEIRLFAQYDNSILGKSHYEKNIGFTLTKDNEIKFHYDIPFCLEKEEVNDKLLRLNKIYIGREAETNDGQMIILNHLIPFLHEREIKYKWIDKK